MSAGNRISDSRPSLAARSLSPDFASHEASRERRRLHESGDGNQLEAIAELISRRRADCQSLAWGKPQKPGKQAGWNAEPAKTAKKKSLGILCVLCELRVQTSYFFRASSASSRVGRDGRARAHQVAVAVRVVDPPDARPVLVGADERQRERRLLARVGMRPFFGRHRARGVRRVLEDVVLGVGLAVDDRLDLGADGDQRLAEAVELVLRLALGRSTIKVPTTGNDTVGAWKP